MNRPLQKNNTSGCVGVGWSERDGKWAASIKLFGKRKGLGNYHYFNDAVIARKIAEFELGFHPNHGNVKRCMD